MAKSDNRAERENLADKIVENARARNDFRGSVKVAQVFKKPSFSGQIRRLSQINVAYNPDYADGNQRQFKLALDAVVEHEMVHKQDGKGRGCPKKEDYDLDRVLTPISEVLRKKGIPNVPFGMQGHTVYTFMANMFEDFVVNNIGSQNRGSEGFFMMYEDMAEHTGCSELFEAFIKLQAMAFPDRTGMHRMIGHFKQSKKANEVYKRYLERTNLMRLGRKERTAYLSNPENWPVLSEIFADEFSKLIDVNDLGACWFQLIGGNDFERLDDEDVQMEIAIKAYGKEGGEFEPPPFMENNAALLALYRKLAKKLEIKVESSSAETKRPVAYVARRQFDFEKDSLERLAYGIGSRGKIEAQTGKYPIMVTSRYQVSSGHFPEVRIGLLDCSSSTQSSLTGEPGKIMNPWADKREQWTDTSIYHHELMCFFGLCELFRRKGTLKNSKVRLGVFSSETRLAKDLAESEMLALQPSFGGTVIDEEYLDEFFAGANSLLYTISDGAVTNWAQIRDKFIAGAKKHNYFHLQIGEETPMYNDLLKEGLVAILDDGKNPAGLLIDLTQKAIYGAQK